MMYNFLLWSLIIFGVVRIVTYSKLFDPFRFYIKNKFKKEFNYENPSYISYGWAGSSLSLSFKICNFFRTLIDCWLCVSFWTGIILTFFGLGVFTNFILNGIVAVSVTTFFIKVLERLEN